MPVFLQGRRAFLSSLRRRHRRCNPLSVHRVSDSGLAYPRRAYSCRACPAAATCHSYPHLAYFVAAACHSYSHLASHAAAAFGYRSAATARASFAVLPGAPHGPCSFSCSTERRTADPRPCSARGTKNGRNRTEVRPPPKSNQSVAAASPRQVFNPSGQCTRLKQTRSV